MPPQRSVILDAELCEHARGEPIRVPLAGHGKLNDLLPDQFCHAISQADRELKLGAHGFKRPVHGADLLGLESESAGSGSWHRGAAGCWTAPGHLQPKPGVPQTCDRHEELKWGTTAATRRHCLASQVLCSVQAKRGNRHAVDLSD